MTKKYNGAVFDFYDTLCHVEEETFVKGRRIVAEKVSVPFQKFYATWKKMGRKNITGKLYSTSDRMMAVLEELNVSPSKKEIHEYAEICDSYFLRATKPYSDALETITELSKRGYELYILSNASSNAERIIRKFNHLLSQFRKIYFSYKHGLAKPDERFFKLLINSEKIDAEKFFYIGDGNDRELDVAKSFGFTTVKVKHPVMASYRFEESTRWDHEIDNLKNLFSEVIEDWGSN